MPLLLATAVRPRHPVRGERRAPPTATPSASTTPDRAKSGDHPHRPAHDVPEALLRAPAARWDAPCGAARPVVRSGSRTPLASAFADFTRSHDLAGVRHPPGAPIDSTAVAQVGSVP
ncbi:hypothetical protein GCM10010428_12380 [Actinosynnema pretiosum subsp. pretiosum]